MCCFFLVTYRTRFIHDVFTSHFFKNLEGALLPENALLKLRSHPCQHSALLGSSAPAAG